MRAFRVLALSTSCLASAAAAAAIVDAPCMPLVSVPLVAGGPQVGAAELSPPVPSRPALPVVTRPERRPWDAHEKALLWSYMSFSAVDAYQTGNMPDGYAEGNPVLRALAGEQPGAAEIMLWKSAAAYGLVHLVDRVERPRQRKALLWATLALQAYVVVHNEQVTGGIVFR